MVGLAFEDGADGAFELALGLQSVSGAADRERLDLFGEFVLEHAQGAGGLTGDEDALAVGEQVGDQVGDGVGLAGAGRPLDDDEFAAAQALGDTALLGVGGQGEVQLLGFGCGLRRSAVRLADGVRSGVSVALGRAGDQAQQTGVGPAALDGPHDLAQSVDLAALGPGAQDQRGSEGDPGTVAVGAGGVALQGLVVVGTRLGGGGPLPQRGVQVLGSVGSGELTSGGEVFPDALARPVAHALGRLQHVLLQDEAGGVGVGGELDTAGLVHRGDDAAGDQMAPDGPVLRGPGEVADRQDEFVRVTEFGELLLDAEDVLVDPGDRRDVAFLVGPGPPTVGPGRVGGADRVPVRVLGQRHGLVPVVLPVLVSGTGLGQQYGGVCAGVVADLVGLDPGFEEGRRGGRGVAQNPIRGEPGVVGPVREEPRDDAGGTGGEFAQPQRAGPLQVTDG